MNGKTRRLLRIVALSGVNRLIAVARGLATDRVEARRVLQRSWSRLPSRPERVQCGAVQAAGNFTYLDSGPMGDIVGRNPSRHFAKRWHLPALPKRLVLHKHCRQASPRIGSLYKTGWLLFVGITIPILAAAPGGF
jgi:hypothetical protein